MGGTWSMSFHKKKEEEEEEEAADKAISETHDGLVLADSESKAMDLDDCRMSFMEPESEKEQQKGVLTASFAPSGGKAEKEADKEVLTSSTNSCPWALKPSVGTWSMPLHRKKKEEEEMEEAADKAASENIDSSVLADSESKAIDVDDCRTVSKDLQPEPRAINVAKLQKKGLSARARTWFFRCVQPSAADPKPTKAPKMAKTQKALNASKASKTTQASKTA